MQELMNITFSSFIQLIVFSIIPFVWWLFTARKISFFKWLGLRKPIFNISVIKLVILILAIASFYTALMAYIMNNIMPSTQTASSQFSEKGIGALPLILIYAVIQTSLSEEIFFRGFLGKRFNHKFGFKIGNVIQAISFGLLHGIPFGIVTENIFVLVLLVLFPGIIGWFQGWMNEKCSSGSILPSWGLHAMMNILSGLGAALL